MYSTSKYRASNVRVFTTGFIRNIFQMFLFQNSAGYNISQNEPCLLKQLRILMYTYEHIARKK